MRTNDLLRTLPSVDELLRHDGTSSVRDSTSHRQVAQWAREAIDQCRVGLLDGTIEPSTDDPATFLLDWTIREIQQRCRRESGSAVQRVINATGIVLHTNLGRAPLSSPAVDRLLQATRYSNVELDLESGRRSRRGDRVCRLMTQLVGAEDTVVVNNCAAATLLVLQAVAAGREVVVSRGQLVEIGGGFRLPDVFRTAGVVLREVGTTNRTYLRDYETALGEETAAIIRVHRSNFHQVGFVTEPGISELVAIDRPREVPVIDDLGSGLVDGGDELGLDEPTVIDSVRSGAEMTLFSGDKLFGGPQAGIIVGKAEWITRLRKHPMMRALRVDKLTLAALEATVEVHLSGAAQSSIPALKAIGARPDEIRARCEDFLVRFGNRDVLSIVDCQSQVGGGSVPGKSLPSYGIQVSTPHADRLARNLRSVRPAIQGRVTENSLLLDFRTVSDDDVELIVQGLRVALDRQHDEGESC